MIIRDQAKKMKANVGILKDVSSDVLEKRIAELEFNPNQPRDPKGTETGGQWTSETQAEWHYGENGYAYAKGKEKFVVSMSDGFPNAYAADVSIEPKNEDGKIFARVSVGNVNDGKYFDSQEEAKAWADQFINPPKARALSTFVKNNGTVMVSKYGGIDIYGRPFTVGTKIYYYRNTKGSGNVTYILPVD